MPEALRANISHAQRVELKADFDVMLALPDTAKYLFSNVAVYGLFITILPTRDRGNRLLSIQSHFPRQIYTILWCSRLEADLIPARCKTRRKRLAGLSSARRQVDKWTRQQTRRPA